jgi:hypothetical protein
VWSSSRLQQIVRAMTHHLDHDMWCLVNGFSCLGGMFAATSVLMAVQLHAAAAASPRDITCS